MAYISETQEAAERDRIAQYWTKERMAAAAPAALPSLSPEQAEDLGLSPPGREAQTDAPTEDGQPFEPDTTSLPYENCGILFFTIPGSGDAWGSAALVGAAGVLLTAAHCVVSGQNGLVYQNIYFVRAYDNTGPQPTGQPFDVSGLHVNQQWINPRTGGNYAYDYAFCTVADPSIWDGYLDLQTDDLIGELTAVGYPSNFGNGRRMYAVTGSCTPSEPFVYMQANPFRQGASGGPWVGNASTRPGGDDNQANGLTSFAIDGYPGVFSPYFDDQTQMLFDQAVGA